MDKEQHIGRMLNGYRPAFALMAANELDVFERLTAPASAAEVAGALNLSPKGTERLLNVLVGLDLVVKNDGKFHLSEEWRAYLTEDGANSMRRWIQLTSDLLPVWVRLAEFIREGNPIQNLMEMLGGDPEKARAFTDAMHRRALKGAWLIAREIPVSQAKRMLDVGGGPGTYALEWAKLNPELQATVLDLPNVLKVTKEYIGAYGLGERVGTQPGDFQKDELGSGYDLVLLGNVLHMYSPDDAQQLVSKAVAALEPGGRIVIHGFRTDEAEASPMEDAMFSLNIGMLTEAGRAHPTREYVDWLEGRGVREIRDFRIEAIPTGVITGTLPA